MKGGSRRCILRPERAPFLAQISSGYCSFWSVVLTEVPQKEMSLCNVTERLTTQLISSSDGYSTAVRLWRALNVHGVGISLHMSACDTTRRICKPRRRCLCGWRYYVKNLRFSFAPKRSFLISGSICPDVNQYHRCLL